MEGSALAISVLAIVIAVVGTYLGNKQAKEGLRESEKSNRTAEESRDIAREALEDSRRTRTDAVWSSAVEAVNRAYGVDPMRQDVQVPLQNLRVSWVALVDALSDWTGLDEWLAAEHARGAAIGREMLTRARSRPPTSEDEHMALLEPFLDWASFSATTCAAYGPPGMTSRRSRNYATTRENRSRRSIRGMAGACRKTRSHRCNPHGDDPGYS